RVASKLGVGKFSNVYGISSNNVTAGQKDYAARMMQIEKQREEHYKSLGTPPGVPTMKGATADPDNTGRGYNDIIGDLGDHSVPEGWVQRPKFNEKGDVPGPPIQWQKPEDPEDAQPGYGYIPTDTTNTEEIFFYHSDHLGSTSYITDAKAIITQFDAYLPYGELLVDEHSSSEEMPYKFNGKELDQETGLYYYGARYMNPITSIWYGVDALTEKYPNIGGFVYCHNNPVSLIDPNGMYDEETAKNIAATYGAEAHQDNKSGLWFVALDETGTKAYTTGGTMTREFGSVDNWKVKGFGEFSHYSDDVSLAGTITSSIAGLRYTESSIFRTGYFRTSSNKVYSLNVLEKQANGKFVRGVQGLRIGASYAKESVKFASKAGALLGAINVSWSAYQMYEEPSFSNGLSLTRNIIGMASWEYGLVDTYISLGWNESKNRAKQSVENISKGLPPDFGIPDPIYGVPDYSSYLFMDSYKKLYNKKNK
ncbi:RHS repeat domain-containing protein, partial [Prevotella conceptionensis]|uniref:RHS repeat domain-containing protein n=1 Tax=Prevotella conceptionensis TaxID=340486 RepID=UPI001E5D9B98